jgi:hypothetical protein
MKKPPEGGFSSLLQRTPVKRRMKMDLHPGLA